MRKSQDSEAMKMANLPENTTFVDKGKSGTVPIGYKKILCHMVYDVKHDGRNKSRLVAGSHSMYLNTESFYVGVTSG
jgi:hypothetical protein